MTELPLARDRITPSYPENVFGHNTRNEISSLSRMAMGESRMGRDRTLLEDDEKSLISVDVKVAPPGIKKLRKRYENPRWKRIQENRAVLDPTERCRQLIADAVMPKMQHVEPQFPPM